MSYELTVDELREAVRTARIYSPSLTEEQFQGVMELQRCLGESGRLEAACGLAQLEKERGTLCTEALDVVEQLLSDKGRLEPDVASLEEEKALLQEENQQLKVATEQAKEGLQTVQAEHQKEERDLAAFKKKAEKEKQTIDRELEEYRRKANVTKEEIVTAGQLKAEVEKHGFSLDLVLGLSQEFAGYGNIRGELAKGLKEGQTLTKYNEQAEERNKTLQADTKSLEGNRQQLESKLSQLRADEAFEKELRRFYHRYQGAEGLLEYLASWDAIYFVRCTNPVFAVTGAFVRSAGGAHFWTDKPPTKCPHCGMAMLQPDEKPYLALNWPVGEPVKLQLRE